MLTLIWLRPGGRVYCGDVFSKMVVFRKSLQTIRFCTLEYTIQ